MKSGITPSGFEYEIDETALDNMELVDALADVDNGNPFAITTVTNLMFGAQQRDKFYKKIKAENDGRVPITVFKNLIVEIFKCMDDDSKK